MSDKVYDILLLKTFSDTLTILNRYDDASNLNIKRLIYLIAKDFINYKGYNIYVSEHIYYSRLGKEFTYSKSGMLIIEDLKRKFLAKKIELLNVEQNT